MYTPATTWAIRFTRIVQVAWLPSPRWVQPHTKRVTRAFCLLPTTMQSPAACGLLVDGLLRAAAGPLLGDPDFDADALRSRLLSEEHNDVEPALRLIRRLDRIRLMNASAKAAVENHEPLWASLALALHPRADFRRRAAGSDSGVPERMRNVARATPLAQLDADCDGTEEGRTCARLRASIAASLATVMATARPDPSCMAQLATRLAAARECERAAEATLRAARVEYEKLANEATELCHNDEVWAMLQPDKCAASHARVWSAVNTGAGLMRLAPSDCCVFCEQARDAEGSGDIVRFEHQTPPYQTVTGTATGTTTCEGVSAHPKCLAAAFGMQHWFHTTVSDTVFSEAADRVRAHCDACGCYTSIKIPVRQAAPCSDPAVQCTIVQLGNTGSFAHVQASYVAMMRALRVHESSLPAFGASETIWVNRLHYAGMLYDTRRFVCRTRGYIAVALLNQAPVRQIAALARLVRMPRSREEASAAAEGRAPGRLPEAVRKHITMDTIVGALT